MSRLDRWAARSPLGSIDDREPRPRPVPALVEREGVAMNGTGVMLGLGLAGLLGGIAGLAAGFVAGWMTLAITAEKRRLAR